MIIVFKTPNVKRIDKLRRVFYYFKERCDTMQRIKQPVLKAVITILYLAAVTVLYLSPISCIFIELFGIRCIGCGMTRALLSAIRFDFASAFGYHAMFWSLPILFLYFVFDGNLFKNKILNRAVFIAIAVGFIINWIVKL